MNIQFIGSFVYALAVIVVILLGLTWVVRALARGRLLQTAERKLVTVVESTYLTQQATVHVLKVGEKFFLVGGGQGGMSVIGELPPDEVNTWIAKQRTLMEQQTQGITSLWKKLTNSRR